MGIKATVVQLVPCLLCVAGGLWAGDTEDGGCISPPWAGESLFSYPCGSALTLGAHWVLARTLQVAGRDPQHV